MLIMKVVLQRIKYLRKKRSVFQREGDNVCSFYPTDGAGVEAINYVTCALKARRKIVYPSADVRFLPLIRVFLCFCVIDSSCSEEELKGNGANDREVTLKQDPV